MFFNAVKKTAEVAGFIETDEPELGSVEVDEVADETSIAAPVKVSSTSIQQRGKIAPYVVDPTVEYNKMAELFGVFDKGSRQYEMSCPSCGEEQLIDATSVDMQQECECPSCGEQDTFDAFYDGLKEEIKSSRTPSDEEIVLVTGKSSHYIDNASWLGRTRQELLDYYGLLNGVGRLVPTSEHTNLGLVNGRWRYRCPGCSEGCDCSNGKMWMYGVIKSLQEAQAEQEED